MKYSEVYNKAADLVEKGWTQYAMARDVHGSKRDFGSKDASSWCLSGALHLGCCDLSSVSSYRKLTSYLLLEDYLFVWNDAPDRTQEDVIKLLRDTATRADKEGLTCE